MFEATLTERDGWTVVMPVGDLDLSSAPDLRRHLLTAVAATDGRVVVDLTAVHFIDSQGLGTLVGGLKRARSRGGDLRLVHPPADVAAVLRLTGLDRAFVVADEVSAAITPAGEAPGGAPDA